MDCKVTTEIGYSHTNPHLSINKFIAACLSALRIRFSISICKQIPFVCLQIVTIGEKVDENVTK